MSKLRIKDAPLLPNIDGTEKIITGGRGDYAISVDQIKEYTRDGLQQEVEDHLDNTSNPHQVNKGQVGLDNVDNTSDLDKPVSNATQEALDLKANTEDVNASLNLKADKNTTYTKTEVDQALGLKSDKTYVDTQDNLKIDKTEKAQINGVATLDSSGKIPVGQLPSYVDDVLEFTSTTLPETGETGKIYVTTDSNRTYRWTGTQYIDISNGGISDSTLKLETSRAISTSGDATWSVSFDGTSNVSSALTLSPSGVVSGTYTKLTVDSKGRVVNGQSLEATDIPILNQNTTGNAETATKLKTPRQISFTGGFSGSGSFDGSSDLNIPVNLTNVETVYTTTNPSLLVANGTIQLLTLMSNSVLSCDVENGQSITVIIPATSYLLDLSDFTIANHFTNTSTTSPTTLVLANVNSVKYLYGINKD